MLLAGAMYSILQPHLQAVVLRRRFRMVSEEFNPVRIDRGREHSMIVGSDGQMLEIDNQKEQVRESAMYPFPGVSSCGVVSSIVGLVRGLTEVRESLYGLISIG